jgi:hypothetical protein
MPKDFNDLTIKLNRVFSLVKVEHVRKSGFLQAETERTEKQRHQSREGGTCQLRLGLRRL